MIFGILNTRYLVIYDIHGRIIGRGLFDEWWNVEDAKLTEDVSDILFDTISYYDYKEDFYHAFLAGMFSGAGYDVRSSSKQGKGSDLYGTAKKKLYP